MGREGLDDDRRLLSQLVGNEGVRATVGDCQESSVEGGGGGGEREREREREHSYNYMSIALQLKRCAGTEHHVLEPPSHLSCQLKFLMLWPCFWWFAHSPSPPGYPGQTTAAQNH